jgi:predicted GIY-YIG superfamily endonuclease
VLRAPSAGMSSGFTLYRLYSSADELLYIGKTIHRFRRFDEHCRRQPWAAEIANASFQELADAAALSAAEIAAIKRERAPEV